MRRMRAAVLREYGEGPSIEQVDRPAIGPRDALVAVEACGICRSDWHAWQGHGDWADDRVAPGQVLGHEPAGRIVEVGEHITELQAGDRVAVPFCLGDGTCRYCRSGHGNVCPDGLALGFEREAGGALAEYVRLPWAEFNAIRLPSSVEFREAAALGCRFMTAFHGLAHRVDPDPGAWVVVVGCSGVGLSAVQVADALGLRVIAADVEERKLERASALGATETVDAGDEDVPEAVASVTGDGAAVSVDAVGRAETCRAAVDALRPTGTHLQLGLTTDAERGAIPLPTDRLTMAAQSFVGSRGMPPSRADELVGLVESGAVDPGALVGRAVPLSQVPDRLAAMTDYDTEGVEVVTEF
jgi:alcohol dehydrogenase